MMIDIPLERVYAKSLDDGILDNQEEFHHSCLMKNLKSLSFHYYVTNHWAGIRQDNLYLKIDCGLVVGKEVTAMSVLFFWKGDNYYKDMEEEPAYHLNQDSEHMSDLGLEEHIWAFTRRVGRIRPTF